MNKTIAGILLGTGLMTTQVMAASELYIGLDLLKSSNTFDVNIPGFGSGSTDIDSSAFKLKFGSTTNDGWRVQGYFAHETYDEPLFDPINDEMNGLGVDIIKGFEITPEFTPFIQGGIGFGWMDLEPGYYSEESISQSSIKVGAGLMYKFVPEVEALIGIDFQYRAWQEIDFGGATMETSEKSTQLYAGLNIHL